MSNAWVRVMVMAFVAVSAPMVSATDIWVSGTGTDSTGDGSFGSPYRTISHAMFIANSDDVIKVLSGDYDEAAGEVFPIPVKDGVDILGQEVDEEDWPRIGGDAGAVTSLIEIRADSTTETKSDILLSRLWFVGEDTASINAPAALHVTVADDEDIYRSSVVNCHFERSAMNGSGDGNANILVSVGETGHTSTFRIEGCTVMVNPRAGIELRPLATSDGASTMTFTVIECALGISGQDVAGAAMLLGGGDDASVFWNLVLNQNEIDSSDVSEPGTDGIVTGIDIFMNATNGKLFRINAGGTQIKANVIRGCSGDGIRVRLDSDLETGSVNNSGFAFENNFVFENFGAGVHLDWNGLGAEGYIQWVAKSNVIAANLYGYNYEGFTDETEGQVGVMANETIVDNASFALRLQGTFHGDSPAPALTNCIVWGNNGGNVQHGGSAGFSPCGQGGMTYSDYMGLSQLSGCSTTNIETNPYFAYASLRNYHLTSSSTQLIDCGNNAGVSDYDIDLSDRTVDGGIGSPIVDMGADEYVPPEE